MKRKKYAPQIREKLSEIAQAQFDAGTTPERVLATFMRNHSGLIADEQADLNELAMNRLAGDVTRTRMGTGIENTITLFGDKKYARTINLWTASEMGSTRQVRNVSTVSVTELRFHAQIERQKRAKRAQKPDPAIDLLESLLEQGASENSKVGDFEEPK